MCMDHRFPWMHRIDSAPGMDGGERAIARRMARAVCARTGVNAAWDAIRRRLHFYFGDCIDVGLFTDEYAESPLREEHIDRIVRLIQLAGVPRAVKDRIAARNAAGARHEHEQRRGSFLENNRKDALDYAGFLERKRRGVPTTGITV